MDDQTTHNPHSDRANILILAAVLAIVTTFFALADNLIPAGQDLQSDAVTALHTVP